MGITLNLRGRPTRADFDELRGNWLKFFQDNDYNYTDKEARKEADYLAREQLEARNEAEIRY